MRSIVRPGCGPALPTQLPNNLPDPCRTKPCRESSLVGTVDDGCLSDRFIPHGAGATVVAHCTADPRHQAALHIRTHGCTDIAVEGCDRNLLLLAEPTARPAPCACVALQRSILCLQRGVSQR